MILTLPTAGESADGADRFELRPRGLGFAFEVKAAGVTLYLDRVRESRGELSGEMTVQGPAGSGPGADGHLFQGRFNLSSHSTRSSLAKHLASRHSMDWGEVLERFCLQINARRRQGEPVVWLGDASARRPGTRQLIRGFLEAEKVTVLAAAGGTGKTTQAAALAYSLASGVEVIPGLLPAGQVKVLVLDYEATEDDWNELLLASARGVNGMPPKGVAYRRMSAPLADQVEELAALCQEHEIGVVIVDSTEAACGASENEGVNDKVNRLHDALRSMKVAALLLDHVAAVDLGKEDALHKPIGGVMKVNRARAVFELKREREPVDGRAEMLLLNTKVNRGAKAAPLAFAFVYENDDAGDLVSLRAERTEVTADELARNLTASDRIHRALGAGPRSVRQLAEDLGKSDGYIRSVLSKDNGRRFVRLQDGSVGRAFHG